MHGTASIGSPPALPWAICLVASSTSLCGALCICLHDFCTHEDMMQRKREKAVSALWTCC